MGQIPHCVHLHRSRIRCTFHGISCTIFASIPTAETPISFTGHLLGGHKGAAVEVPFDPDVQWGVPPERLRKGRDGHRVEATINGVKFQGAIVPRVRRFWSEVPEEAVVRADVAAVAEVRIRLTPLL